MFDEDYLLPVSALQHLAFCERQWALMYLENLWAENPLTVEGRLLHKRADQPGSEMRAGIRVVRGLRLRSLQLGLVGRADVVEFIPIDKGSVEKADELTIGVGFSDAGGLWRLSPVEYKHGRPKSGYCDKVQLCAQALCLEEMLHTRISSGAIYYGRMRKRLPVDFDDALRDATKSLAGRLHELTRKGLTPPADYTRKCRNCSLLSVCLPRVTSGRRSVKRYLATALEESGKTDKEILP